MGATWSFTTTFVAGNVLTAAQLNTLQSDVTTNFTPAGLDDSSANVAAMKTVADPGEVGTESLATSQEGENHRMRNMLKEITGEAQWYVTNTISLIELETEHEDDGTHRSLAIADKTPGQVIRSKFIYAESLDYDGGSVIFTVGDTATGAGGATGYVEAVTGDATSGTLYLSGRNATAYINDEALTSAAGVAVVNQISSKNSTVIQPGVYHHEGTTQQMLYWDSDLTYEFVSLGTSDWSYLYLDDSAIVTADTNLITTTQLIDSTTEPAWNASKHGWYNGLDRCIFAVLTDGSDNILEFYHSNDFIQYADRITERSAATVSNVTWADVDIKTSVPIFSTFSKQRFGALYVDGTSDYFYRVNGQTGTTGHYSTGVGVASTFGIVSVDVITDSAQIYEVLASASTNDTLGIETIGWYLPIGMS